MNVYELEWNITLSRYDFPWHEISFEQFSAIDCYKMYNSCVKSAEDFYKIILGEKSKYHKMMHN